MILARKAVPCGELVTNDMDFLTKSRFVIFIPIFLKFPNLELLDESKSDLFNEIPFVKRGVTAFPPLTMRDVITANCRGVARINPCPIPANKVSPCCQDEFLFFFFHSRVGIRPFASPDNSILNI